MEGGFVEGAWEHEAKERERERETDRQTERERERDNTPLRLSAPCRSGWLFHTAYQTSPLSLHIRPAKLSFCKSFGLEVWDES